MRKTKIEMDGINKEERVHMRARASRVIEFPDGLTRHVTLRNWHWVSLDWLINDRKWEKSRIPGSAFNLAQEWASGSGDLETEIRMAMELLIHYAIKAYVEEERGTANENKDYAV